MILTVAAPPAVARAIVQLMGEAKEKHRLWISLTPLAQRAAGP